MRETIEFNASHRRGGLALIGYENHNRAACERALALISKGKLNLEQLAYARLAL